MQIPLIVTFRDIDQSDAIENAIREKAKKLERFHDRITSCRVVVSAPHKHNHQGKIYHITIEITIPGGGGNGGAADLVVSREPEKNHAHEDIYVAIRDAFKAAEKQLDKKTKMQRGKPGDVKTHVGPPHGLVTAVIPTQDHGFITAEDGRNIYFHRNSVINEEFDKISEGTPVWFNEEMGDEGPQASTVHVVGK